jgi:hypothetical protein
MIALILIMMMTTMPLIAQGFVVGGAAPCCSAVFV